MKIVYNDSEIKYNNKNIKKCSYRDVEKMVNDDDWVNVYELDINNKLDKKKIFILIVCICIFISLILTITYTIKISNGYKIYKQYEAQLASINHQEEENKAKIAEEEKKKREEKIPKLTNERKK